MVKISDFGLTKNLHEIAYYKFKDDNKALPIRWTSPEALQKNVHSKQSDVVSKLTNNPKKKVLKVLSLASFLRTCVIQNFFHGSHKSY